MSVATPHMIDVGSGATRRKIAVLKDAEPAGGAPTFVWLGGYRSDMRGTKAAHLAALAKEKGFGFVRFDYSGHGESSGSFEDGTISLWTEDAAHVVRSAVTSPAILVASSMGAWIALKLIRDGEFANGRRIAGLLLLAPAPDFTERLIMPQLDASQRETLAREGRLTRPSAYSQDPDIYTIALMTDGADNQVMDGLIETGCPIAIIQGMADADVPYEHALDLVTHLPSDGVTLTLVPGGDHRLSRPQDLALIGRIATDLAQAASEE